MTSLELIITSLIRKNAYQLFPLSKMIVKFVSFPGNMEFDVVNTPCPGYKTLKRRYTILVFPRVNIKLTQKQNMVKQEKIF